MLVSILVSVVSETTLHQFPLSPLLPYLSHPVLAPFSDRIGPIEMPAGIRIGLSLKTSAEIGYDQDGARKDKDRPGFCKRWMGKDRKVQTT
jgi:hypothetical protein